MTIHVLLVDDEKELKLLILQKFRKQIQKEKFHFTFAVNGSEALAKMEEGLHVDVILADINMPIMDGLSLIPELNKRDPLLQLVVISTDNDIDSIRKAMNLGAFDFLKKPLNFEDMEVTINKTFLHIRPLRENLEARLEAEEKWRREEAARTSLEELDKLKNEFIGFMTHELRTPLNTVLANASFLEISMTDCTFLEEEGLTQLDLIKRIKHGGEVLLQLIKSSLDLRKLEAGKMRLDCQQHDMAAMIAELVNGFITLAKQKGLVIEFENHCPPPYWVMFDKIYFLQVLRNLTGNAIQFTKEGRIVLSLREEHEEAVIAVQDTGCGIPKEDIARIFNQFEQVRRKQQEQQGTVLGLAYCREMVTLHQGSISVESEEGKGSEFTVRIPKRQSFLSTINDP